MGTATQKGSSAWLRNLIPHDRIWRVVDAEGQILGRVAVQIAVILRGGHKAYYFDNMNCGDPVVVINAEKFVLMGRKAQNKLYYRHSGYPGGLKKTPITQLLDRRPEEPIRRAVYNMLPRNKLRPRWMENLYVYAGEKHPHQSQNPVPVARADINMQLKTGGPPTSEELDTWWTEHLLSVSDVDLQRIVSDVRKKQAQRHSGTGLAQLLSASDADDPALKRYISAAEDALREDAVVIPPTPA